MDEPTSTRSESTIAKIAADDPELTEADRQEYNEGEGGADNVCPEDCADTITQNGNKVYCEAQLDTVLDESNDGIQTGSLAGSAKRKQRFAEGVQEDDRSDQLENVGVRRAIRVEKGAGERCRVFPGVAEDFA